jgi:RNA polymerase sigma-70 factor, ECF subfamily
MSLKGLAATVEHSNLGVVESSDPELPEARRPREDGSADQPGRVERVPSPPDFEQVYSAHFEFVWRSLRLLGVPPEAVEDAAQDTFSVVSRQLPDFEGRSSVRTWLFAIIQRVAANHRRTQRRKLRQLEPLDEGLVAKDPTPEAHAQAQQVVEAIQTFSDSLKDEWRSLFVLALLEQIPAPEVAEALGLPVNTVYSRVRNLRDGLRRALVRREVQRG